MISDTSHVRNFRSIANGSVQNELVFRWFTAKTIIIYPYILQLLQFDVEQLLICGVVCIIATNCNGHGVMNATFRAFDGEVGHFKRSTVIL